MNEFRRSVLTRFLVLFLIDLSSRRVQVTGVTREANGCWMRQVTRNLVDAAKGFLMEKPYLIHDCDPRFAEEFLTMPEASGIESVNLPPRAPNLKPDAERFVRTVKESCLERMILFGERLLRKGIYEFMKHYHHEPHRQSLGNRLIRNEEPCADTSRSKLAPPALG